MGPEPQWVGRLALIDATRCGAELDPSRLKDDAPSTVGRPNQPFQDLTQPYRSAADKDP